MTKFTGEGFSKEEFSEDERARHREALREYEKDFTFLRSGANIGRSAKTLAAIIAIFAALGAALAYLSSRGLL